MGIMGEQTPNKVLMLRFEEAEKLPEVFLTALNYVLFLLYFCYLGSIILLNYDQTKA